MWSSWFLWGNPSMRFFIDSLASTIQAYFVLCSSTVRQVACTCHVEVSKALRLASEFPTFYAHFQWYPWIPRHQDQWSEYHAIFWHYRVEVFHWTDRPLWILFAFRCIGHIFPNLWPQSVWPGGRLFSCQSLPRPCISIRRFFIQYGESCEICPCIWQFSISINVPIVCYGFSNITSNKKSVVLVTSIYFSGIGNNSSFGTYNLTLGTSWWRSIKLSEMEQKSFLTSPSYLDESRSGVQEDPSDSLWRLPCSCSRSGRSRIKTVISSRKFYCSICDWKYELFATHRR